MRTSFVLISGGGEEVSVLRVANVLLLIRLSTKTNSSERTYISLQYMKCTPVLCEVDKELTVCF